MKTNKRRPALKWIMLTVLVLSGVVYALTQTGYLPMLAFMMKQPALMLIPAGTRDARWQQTVEYLGSQLPYLHVNPYFKIGETEFQNSVTKLSDEVPNLNDEQIIVGMLSIIASLGDGHTRAYPESEPVDFRRIPLEMRWVEERLMVVSAGPEYSLTVGAQVMQIGEHPVAEVYDAVKSLISADNEIQILDGAPTYMAMPAILYGLNLIPEKDRATFLFESRDGSQFSLELQPAAAHAPESFISLYEQAGITTPLYEQNRDSYYWYQYLTTENAVYVQYNHCAEENGRPFQSFVDEVFEQVDRDPTTRLVLDLRFNGGGNESVLDPFIDALQARPTMNTPERLFVIIGSGTYSSALQNAITLSQEMNATLVGEATGGKPNHYGEVRQFRLPNIGLLVQYSTRYWLNYPGSDPLTLEPDIQAPLTVHDLLTGRDPALDATLQP